MSPDVTDDIENMGVVDDYSRDDDADDGDEDDVDHDSDAGIRKHCGNGAVTHSRGWQISMKMTTRNSRPHGESKRGKMLLNIWSICSKRETTDALSSDTR